MKKRENKILEIKNLCAWYDQLQILYGVNIHLNKGEIVSIIGPNGAGKSTTLKTVFGFVEKREGTIVFKKEEITKATPEEMVKKGIGYVPQGRSLFPSLTVMENLEMGAYIQKDKENVKKEIQHILEMFPQLKKYLDKTAGVLSGGEQQMIAIARTLLLKPDVLLLDEPSLGLSPQIKRVIFEKILEINKKRGISILIVEQNAKVSLELSDRAYVLEQGRNRLEGTGKELLHDKRVQHLYLGGEF